MLSYSDAGAMKSRILEELYRYPFRAPWWLKNTHAQTSWVALVRKKQGLLFSPPFRRERWDTPDDDFLDLVFVDGEEHKPLVILFHGLEGAAESYYVTGYGRVFKELGWTFTTMLFRSCGFDMNRKPRTYHMGAIEDPIFVLEKLRERYPDRPFFGIGVSLGGCVLGNLLGLEGERARQWLDGAMLLSPPYDPAMTAPYFHEVLNGFYVRHFIVGMKEKALGLAERFPGLLDEEALQEVRDFYDFDNAVTAPLNGFSGAEDYWEKTGCGQQLPGIQVPTLLITALDDFFVLPQCVPYEAAEKSPWLYPLFTDRGGHGAFVYGPLPVWTRSWYEEQSVRFFKALLRESGHGDRHAVSQLSSRNRKRIS
ncbi:MAG: hypothetical protein GX130_06370 [Candidatus Hydrogenedens sp.]|nr:hypothetical protein [Candidatus Hydrogenedens sp.]